MIAASIHAPSFTVPATPAFDYPCLLRLKEGGQDLVLFAQCKQKGFVLSPRTDIKQPAPFGLPYEANGTFENGKYEFYPCVVTINVGNK